MSKSRYLSDLMSTQGVVETTTTGTSTNWQTAFSWGDHSSAGYFNSVNLTALNANDVLMYNGSEWTNSNELVNRLIELEDEVYLQLGVI